MDLVFSELKKNIVKKNSYIFFINLLSPNAPDGEKFEFTYFKINTLFLRSVFNKRTHSSKLSVKIQLSMMKSQQKNFFFLIINFYF